MGLRELLDGSLKQGFIDLIMYGFIELITYELIELVETIELDTSM